MRKEWSEVVANVVDKCEEWKQEGRTYLVIVDNEKKSNDCTASFGGNFDSLYSMMATLMKKNIKFAHMIIGLALQYAESGEYAKD